MASEAGGRGGLGGAVADAVATSREGGYEHLGHRTTPSTAVFWTNRRQCELAHIEALES